MYKIALILALASSVLLAQEEYDIDQIPEIPNSKLAPAPADTLKLRSTGVGEVSDTKVSALPEHVSILNDDWLLCESGAGTLSKCRVSLLPVSNFYNANGTINGNRDVSITSGGTLTFDNGAAGTILSTDGFSTFAFTSLYQFHDDGVDLLFGAGTDLTLQGSKGTAGQYLGSNGIGSPPTWQDIGASSGEDNTSSNEGVDGVGIVLPKSGLNLPFKSINAASGAILITDDVANNEVDVDVIPGGIDHNSLQNYAPAEHRDWGVDQGANNIHPNNYTDNDTVYDDTAIQTEVDLNTLKQTNATHSGDVSGSTTLTITAGAVDADELASTTVTAGSCTNCDLTVDEDGRITAASNGTGGGGSSDHGALTGLGDDDHPQYHNDTRGDARYEPINANIQAHIASTANPHGVTKTQVGLSNVDNTADLSKPISTATQTALDAKSDDTHLHTGVYEPANANIQSHIANTSNPHLVTATQVGLGNVDNTSDANKPISTATQTALDGKGDFESDGSVKLSADLEFSTTNASARIGFDGLSGNGRDLTIEAQGGALLGTSGDLILRGGAGDSAGGTAGDVIIETVGVFAAGVSDGGTIRLRGTDDANNGGSVDITSGTGAFTNGTVKLEGFTFPRTDGSNTHVLKTDGNKVLAFAEDDDTPEAGDFGGTPDGTKFLRDDLSWQVVPGGGGGEANTYSNSGAGGIEIILTKSGVDLPFKSINAASGAILISNDAVNNEVDVDVIPGGVDHNSLQNYSPAEHRDWGLDQGANDIHPNNYIDTDTTDHTALSNIGTNTHAQLDTHVADGTTHFTQASISITESQISDLSHTSNTNAGTLCSAGEFLNGDTTCDPVVVDTNTQATQTKAISILNPLDTDDTTMFFTTQAITVSQTTDHIEGTGTVFYNISFASTRTGTPIDLFSSNQGASSLSGASRTTGFNDNTIPANRFVWLDVTSISGGTPTFFHTTVIYTED